MWRTGHGEQFDEPRSAAWIGRATPDGLQLPNPAMPARVPMPDYVRAMNLALSSNERIAARSRSPGQADERSAI